MDYTAWWLHSTIVVIISLVLCAETDGQPPVTQEESLPFDLCSPEYRGMSEEQRLLRDLMHYYDPSVRPVYDAHSTVDVNLGLTLTQILDLDEKNQVLTTNVWLEASWYDERLNWTSTIYDGIVSIRIPCHRIWLPDIVLYNSVDDYTSGYMPSLAMVYNDSRVFWGPVIRFRSACNIDITFFPFDTQICKMKMGSWAYNGLQVDVWNRSNTMDISNFVDNGEWELLGIRVERNVVYYACCKEPYPDVTFTIFLRRRTKYYFMNIIIPCIILSFLCLGGFLLPPESGEKITLGLSVLLTITVFMLMVADKMPQTSESISVISIYLMAVLSTSCMSVLSSVLVLSIHHQRGKPKRPPLWLRRLCFGVIGRAFRVGATTSSLDNKTTEATEEMPPTTNTTTTTTTTSNKKNRNSKKRKRQVSNYCSKRDTMFMNNSRIGCPGEESECLNLDPKITLSTEGTPEHVQIAPSMTTTTTTDGNKLSNCNSNRNYDHHFNSRRHPNNYPRHNLNFQTSSPNFSSYREVDVDTSFVVTGNVNVRDCLVCNQILTGCTCDKSSHYNTTTTMMGGGGGDGGGGPGGGGGGDQKLDPYDADEKFTSKQQQQQHHHHQQQYQHPHPHRRPDSEVSAIDNILLDDPSILKGMNINQKYNIIMVSHLTSLIRDKQDDQSDKEDIFQEWHNVAYVLDRILFLFFFLITILSTLGILQMRPSPVQL